MKKIVSAISRLLLIIAFSFCLCGMFLEFQMAHASPYTNISAEAAYHMITSGLYPDLVVLDVRTQGEYDGGHIYRAMWIPVSELPTRIGELAGREDHEIIVYCKSGGRSATASSILDSKNFTKVFNMLGGMDAWRSAGCSVWIATVHNLNTTFNYDTIQAAISAPQALDGHTITVDAETYYEQVVVDKSISLIGENRATTFIDGNGTFVTILHIMTNNVTIRGFTIQNDAPIHCLEGGGIYITDSNRTNIVDNIITHTQYPINLRNSTNNTIIGNTIIENDVGIQLLDHHSNKNTIYHNDFLENGVQVSNFGASNYWDDGYPSGGNYWSNHTGPDSHYGPYQNLTGSDGIVDTPYVIDVDNQDNYPLMSPYEYWSDPIPGDINRDRKVDFDDIVAIAMTYGSEPGDSNWNPNADLDNDGHVDFDDVVTAAMNYGKRT